MELIQRINRTSLFISTICLIGFGAVLLQDGLADARNSLPGGIVYWDGKEVAIGAALLFIGGLLLTFVFRTLPNIDSRTALVRSGIVLAFGLMLALAFRVADLRVEKPYWFTSNVSGYLIDSGGEAAGKQQVVFRKRALAEEINRMARAERTRP